MGCPLSVSTSFWSWALRAHVVFIPGIRFSILNKLTFQVTWLQTRHPLHLGLIPDMHLKHYYEIEWINLRRCQLHVPLLVGTALLLLVMCLHWSLFCVMACNVWEPRYSFGLISLRSWLTWLNHLVLGLPGSLLVGRRVSCKACCTGVSVGSLIRCLNHCSMQPFYQVGVTSACYVYQKNSYLDYSTHKLLMIPHTNFEMVDDNTHILKNDRASSTLAKKIT